MTSAGQLIAPDNCQMASANRKIGSVSWKMASAGWFLASFSAFGRFPCNSHHWRLTYRDLCKSRAKRGVESGLWPETLELIWIQSRRSLDATPFAEVSYPKMPSPNDRKMPPWRSGEPARRTNRNAVAAFSPALADAVGGRAQAPTLGERAKGK
jgi:hypothetical protein